LTSLLWFRRDLRLGDHPALAHAAGAGPVVALFVLDPVLLGPAGGPRTAFLYRCLRALDEASGGRLVVRAGDPVEVVPAVAAEIEAATVCVSADFGPYGRRRDEQVARALAAAGRSLVPVGSPYAVDPGRVRKGDGGAFQVFSPFYRAWRATGWPPPAGPVEVDWATPPPSTGIPDDPLVDATLPAAGEAPALARLDRFLAGPVAGYPAGRDHPAEDATTRLSPYLKYGCIHPRRILGRLDRSVAHETLRRELAWREFYADVLWHRPDSARRSLQPGMAGMRLDSGPVADRRFQAWADGRTGYPLVDAGMRQLLGEAWVHNRVRMVVASFLVKDLHIDWARGARWFLQHLVDGDLASNNHGWQWVAGTGTDPAPYFRIFNPVTQGKEHDPDGDYVRRWVPELAGVPGPAVHEPWKLPGGRPSGYPDRIVDHAVERVDALARYGEVKDRR
jgi:deoxyribodipyrimidine photo-lyase